MHENKPAPGKGKPKPSAAGAARKNALSPRIENRRAHHDYHVLEKWEAGIALVGSEVKSARQGRVQLAGSFAIVRGGKVTLMGCHIEEYEQANQFNHDPTRNRSLLLHKREILRIAQHMAKQPGTTLIPLAIYFQRGYAKVLLALAIGKAKFDKRQDIKQREAKRAMDRALKRR